MIGCFWSFFVKYIIILLLLVTMDTVVPPCTSDITTLTESIPLMGSANDALMDVYAKLVALQTQVEFLELKEDYVRDDQKNLKRELQHAKAEILRIRSVPLVIGQFLSMIDENHGIVSSTAGSNYYVRVLSTLNR